MKTTFTYKIETLATESMKRFETHIKIEHLGKSTSFFSGLYCNPDTYTNINRNSFSLDPVHYGFQKCYWFAQKWIEILLYEYYIESLLNPENSLINKAQNRISDDIKLLGEFKSFDYSLVAFLLDNFRNLDEDEPKYYEYASFHRLLDCMLDYQLRSRVILTNKSENKVKFFESIEEYKIQGYRFKLTSELIVFLTWSIENNLELIDERCYSWMIDNIL